MERKGQEYFEDTQSSIWGLVGYEKGRSEKGPLRLTASMVILPVEMGNTRGRVGIMKPISWFSFKQSPVGNSTGNVQLAVR